MLVCGKHGCQMAIAGFLESYVFGPSGFWTVAPLRYPTKFDSFLSLDCAPTPSHPGAIQGKEGIKFCHLATMVTGIQVPSRGPELVRRSRQSAGMTLGPPEDPSKTLSGARRRRRLRPEVLLRQSSRVCFPHLLFLLLLLRYSPPPPPSSSQDCIMVIV